MAKKKSKQMSGMEQSRLIVIIASVVIVAMGALAAVLLMPDGNQQTTQLPRYKPVDNVCPYINTGPLNKLDTEVVSTTPSGPTSIGVLSCTFKLSVKKNPDGSKLVSSTDYFLKIEASFSEVSDAAIKELAARWDATTRRSDRAATVGVDFPSSVEDMPNLGDQAYFKRSIVSKRPDIANGGEAGTIMYKENILSQNMYLSVELSGLVHAGKVDGHEFDGYVRTIVTDTMNKLKT